MSAISSYLIKWHCKSSINIMTMKYSHSNYPADKMKVRKVIWVHSTVWINLKRIDIIPGITDLKVRLKLHKGQYE